MFALSTSSLSFNFFEGTHSAYFSNFFFPYIPLQCSSDQNIPYTPVPKTVIYGHWLLAVMQPNSETICALTVHSKYLFSVSINTVHYKSLFSWLVCTAYIPLLITFHRFCYLSVCAVLYFILIIANLSVLFMSCSFVSSMKCMPL